MRSVNGQEFLELLESTDQPVVVDLYADWCMPCRAAAPHFEALAKKYEKHGAIFLKINVDYDPGIAQALGVMGVPSFFILRGKTISAKVVGANMRKLEEAIKKELKIQTKSKPPYTAYM